MDRQASESHGRPQSFALRAVLCVLLLGAAAAIPAGSTPADGASAPSLLAAAQRALRQGETDNAQELLRRLRAAYPDSPLLIDSLGLSVECSLAAGDDFRARYFLQKLIDAAPASPTAFASCIAVARHSYAARAWAASLEYYEKAITGFREGTTGRRADLGLPLLRAAELYEYRVLDASRARDYFKRVDPRTLPASERPLYRQMQIRLCWSVLSADALGLKDANISSLRVDGDDLWIGTWNGGVARYSVSAGSRDAFPSPAISRSIEVADRRVWIGTTEGLAWYGKGTGRWGVDLSGTAEHSLNVQVVRQTSSGLYAGTLGDGLFRLTDAGWEQMADGSLPGRFITCIAGDAAHGTLLIGTMNIGLVILDLKTGAMRTLAESVPQFTSSNITAVLPGADGRVWIGTYGEGLAVWTPGTNSLRRYTTATAELGDDWILSACETDRALYFGSFGGGVSVLSKADGSWRRIGIADGLASLDVAAIAWRAPRLYFGTLGSGVSVYDEAADGAHP